MAKEVLTNNSLVLRYQVGVNNKGEGVFNKQSFKNISPLATEDELLDLAGLVDEVIDYRVSEVRKEQTYVLLKA